MNSLQKSKKPRFKKVYIEITNVCNLQCDFCPKTKRTPKFLTIPEFEHVIEEVSPYTNHIYLHIMGEPLLHENLKEFIEIAGKKNIKVNLTTNGTLLSPEKEFLLDLSALRQINISLHSFEANEQNLTVHDYVRSVMGFIKKATKQSGVLCSVRLWNMDFGDLKGANSLNREIIQLIESELEIKESLEEKLCKEHSCKVSHNVYLNMAQKFEWPDIERDMLQNEVFCYGLRDQLGILVDGTVVPCCLDSEGTINLGNLYKQDLDTILTSERAKMVYDGFSRRVAVEDLCKRCGYATRF
jgi:radical SAM protein with 4Fe4S-binding SPASM domain